MKLQVLISTMNQKDHVILDKMNIQTDAIVVNQCNQNFVENVQYMGKQILFMSLAERGIGLSRNTALMRSEAQICLFADDDEVFVDSYEDIICQAFEKNPKADLILFNVKGTSGTRPCPYIKSSKQIHIYNCLRYGTVSFAIRRKSAIMNNLSFSLLFGGGAKYGSGEDSLFLVEAIRKGLRIISSPETIAYVNSETSTWFNGYNEKFFRDKGAFFAAAFRKKAKIVAGIQVLRHYKTYCQYYSFFKIMQYFNEGIKEYNNLEVYP